MNKPKGIDTLSEDIVWLYEDYRKALRETRTTQFSEPNFEGFIFYLRFGYIDRNSHK